PYFEPGRISAPGAEKAGAYLESLSLDGWIKAMAFAAKPRAPIVIIHRAAELARILAVLDRLTGEITVLPIAPKHGEDARRVLVRGRKGLRRGEVRLLAPLVTHTADGEASEALDAIRHGRAIDW
ncbi:MAG TPA: SAM-dependent methyltransferase, partial [Hyphomonas sp.]|nr:SAM-dependent methyltransferase [Hyphomonas sp.]